MASISNLPVEVRDRVLFEINRCNLATAFRSTSRAMRNRASDQAFLDRLSKLMTFVWAKRNSCLEPGFQLTVDLMGKGNKWTAIDKLRTSDNPDVFYTNTHLQTRAEILQTMGILSHSVTSIQVRLYKRDHPEPNDVFDEIVMDFPAPRFAMSHAECLQD